MWLINRLLKTQADHALYKYLPKIIRSQDDCWGKDDKKAQYVSPISNLIIKYQQHIIENIDKPTFKELDLSRFDDASSRVVDNIKEIRKQLNYIENGFQSNNSDDDNEQLQVSSFVGVETLDICLDFPIDQDLQTASEKDNNIAVIIFITAFAKFLLHRVCLTYVEVNNESYAFDMFEALNTTGEPLTAIETFVPKVIEHIGVKQKEAEPDSEAAMETLNSITERFDKIKKTEDKKAKTKSLILAFVRAYEGKVKVTSLRDQRDAMLKSYEQCLYHNKDRYLIQLAETARFLFNYWQTAEPDVSSLVPNKDINVANVCLSYLIDM